MAHARFEIELPGYFRHRDVLSYLGRDPASLTERVEGRSFAFGTTTACPPSGGHAVGAPAIVRVELGERLARCRVEAAARADAGGLRAETHRLLGLVIDPRPFERRAAREGEIARLIRGRRGLSIPQTRTVFDALVWVIAGQQVSLPVAFALRRRLTRRVGVRIDDSLWAPPPAESVAVLEPPDLHDLGYSRRKAEYLLGVARAITDGSLESDGLAGRSAAAVEGRLLEVRGLGPWSVNYLLMRALGHADRVPIGDAALTRNLKRFFSLEERPGPDATRELMAPFAPHRSLATFHLWAWKGTS